MHSLFETATFLIDCSDEIACQASGLEKPSMSFLTIIFQDFMKITDCLKSRDFIRLAEMTASKEESPILQFLKYALCGSASVVVHNIAFAIIFWFLELNSTASVDLQLRETRVIIANFLAFPIGNLFAYWVNVKWVFSQGKHSKFTEFLLFTGISLLSFTIGLLGGPVLISEGLPVWAAQIGFVITSALANFVCRKFLVFSR